MLEKVLIDSDALQVCMAHALSTEKEEIMGLLVGEVFVYFVTQNWIYTFFLKNIMLKNSFCQEITTIKPKLTYFCLL